MTRKGIVVVHGVGAQRHSDTLLDIGGPLLDWAAAWGTHAGYEPRFNRAGLAFNLEDDGLERDPPHVSLDLLDRRGVPVLSWTVAEAWWSYSLRQPPLFTVVSYYFVHLPLAFGHIVALVAERLRSLFRSLPRGLVNLWRMLRGQPIQNPLDPNAYDANLVMVAINALNSVFAALLIVVAFIVGIVPVVILALATLIPIPAVQDFIAVRFLSFFLLFNAAQFRAFLVDEVQAANMRARVEKALQWLRSDGCEEIYVIAHSEGAVLAFNTLSHLESTALRRRVKKLFTFGAGLNLAWLARPALRRLHGPLPRSIQWVDFWTSYDPVPGGPLRPPPGSTIFDPSPEVEAQMMPLPGAPTDPLLTIERPGGGPVSEQVTGQMDVLTDHGAYWGNFEEVLSRVAQEVDEPNYTQSRFWKGNGLRVALASRLWTRITVLVALRGAAIIAFFAFLAREWGRLAGWGSSAWALAQSIPLLGPTLMAFSGIVLVLPATDWLPRVLPTLLGIGLVAAVYWIAYQLLPLYLWSRWHEGARRDSVFHLQRGDMNRAPRHTIPPHIWALLAAWIALLIASVCFLPLLFDRFLLVATAA